jgi:hypothetical protein
MWLHASVMASLPNWSLLTRYMLLYVLCISSWAILFPTAFITSHYPWEIVHFPHILRGHLRQQHMLESLLSLLLYDNILLMLTRLHSSCPKMLTLDEVRWLVMRFFMPVSQLSINLKLVQTADKRMDAKIKLERPFSIIILLLPSTVCYFLLCGLLSLPL